MTTETGKHTETLPGAIKLPLRAGIFQSGTVVVETNDGKAVAHIYGPEFKLNYEVDRWQFAEFIVRAVNSHEALLDAVKRMEMYLNSEFPHPDKLQALLIGEARDAIAQASERGS